eukprot:TRINITY_DN4851_c0_g1_i2.p1 TRINITY_DN4851_c0_g1~~TRINITY_DN4851_c0_g1_i2.p1  ORF type:complete len:328 (+),score=77.66 TRINITY_DN4851_c0_g1_i2:35-985(+)
MPRACEPDAGAVRCRPDPVPGPEEKESEPAFEYSPMLHTVPCEIPSCDRWRLQPLGRLSAAGSVHNRHKKHVDDRGVVFRRGDFAVLREAVAAVAVATQDDGGDSVEGEPEDGGSKDGDDVLDAVSLADSDSGPNHDPEPAAMDGRRTPPPRADADGPTPQFVLPPRTIVQVEGVQDRGHVEICLGHFCAVVHPVALEPHPAPAPGPPSTAVLRPQPCSCGAAARAAARPVRCPPASRSPSPPPPRVRSVVAKAARRRAQRRARLVPPRFSEERFAPAFAAARVYRIGQHLQPSLDLLERRERWVSRHVPQKRARE